MHRRHFIRVLGGGTIAAAVPPMAACSSDFPETAVRPWRGPAADEEPRRWALGYAILAPNPHNRQPWQVDLRGDNTITLHVDRERLLPMTDPWSRQVMIGQGTFLESLVLALRERGLAPEVTLFPEGEFAPRTVDDRPVARVRWQPGAAAPARDPLFGQILKRHTAKIDYDTSRPVAAATLAALRTGLVDPGVRFGGTVDPARLAPLRELCVTAARIELQTPRTVMESAALTRVGPAEIDAHRDGISINAFFPRLLAAVGAFDRSQPPAEGSTTFEQMMARFEGHSRSAMGFVWLSTPTRQHAAAGTTRRAEVDAGRAYMRLQLKATELGLQMHPMSQAPQEFPEMKQPYDEVHRLTVEQPAAIETLQMFCRIGYCADQQRQPRRGVDAILKT